MAEIVSNAVPSLGFTLEVAAVPAMTSAVKVAGLRSIAWSGFEADSIDVTESESKISDGTNETLAYRSAAGRPRYGVWTCTGRLILSLAIVGDQEELLIANMKSRAQKYWRITFVSGKTMTASGFVKSFDADLGEGGAMDSSWVIELDGQYLLIAYA